MTELSSWLFSGQPAEYHSYLVRIWRPSPQAEWRIMVELITGGQRHSFANLEELFLFLRTQLSSSPPPSADSQTQ